MENFEKAIKFLKKQSADTMELSKIELKTEYESIKYQKLFFTIPYDEGWNIIVNGKKTSIQKVAGNFIGVDVKKGKNIVKLEYHVPGLTVGRCLSVLGIVGFVVCDYRKRKNSKGKV